MGNNEFEEDGGKENICNGGIFITAAKNNRHRKRKYFADLKTKKNYCRRIFLPFISAAVALAPARSEAEALIS